MHDSLVRMSQFIMSFLSVNSGGIYCPPVCFCRNRYLPCIAYSCSHRCISWISSLNVKCSCAIIICQQGDTNGIYGSLVQALQALQENTVDPDQRHYLATVFISKKY